MLNRTIWKLAGQANAFSSRVSAIHFPPLNWGLRISKWGVRYWIHRKLLRVFREKTVLHGPFKGMKYPGFNAVSSAIFPKLLGSYECELTPVFYEITQRSYSKIIDIGCAEGYYAVGLAIRIEDAMVYAYDTLSAAQSLCKEMAQYNDVQDRVIVAGELTASKLSKFRFSGRGLVVYDCEGFEEKLFTSEVIENLKACDVIIEFHDFLSGKQGLAKKIVERFESTHDCRMYRSTSDEYKVEHYSFPEITTMGELTRRYATAERRPTQMEWGYFTPQKKALH